MPHSVNLSWTASTDAVTGYNVYRGVTTGNENTLVNLAPVTTVTFDDTTPSAGQYFYIVTSILNGVESLHSNEVTVSLRPAAPTNLVVVSAS